MLLWPFWPNQAQLLPTIVIIWATTGSDIVGIVDIWFARNHQKFLECHRCNKRTTVKNLLASYPSSFVQGNFGNFFTLPRTIRTFLSTLEVILRQKRRTKILWKLMKSAKMVCSCYYFFRRYRWFFQCEFENLSNMTSCFRLLNHFQFQELKFAWIFIILLNQGENGQ